MDTPPVGDSTFPRPLLRGLRRAAVVAIVVVPLGALPAQAALELFQSPSGNIGCAMTSGGDGIQARCDIALRSWKAPPKPRWCKLDWGQGVMVGARGRASYVCAGDTALHEGSRLGYGRSIVLGRLRCTSLTSGVRCTNRLDGHGFEISRQRVRLF
jgi:uncharacterized protein DUF6636